MADKMVQLGDFSKLQKERNFPYSKNSEISSFIIYSGFAKIIFQTFKSKWLPKARCGPALNPNTQETEAGQTDL